MATNYQMAIDFVRKEATRDARRIGLDIDEVCCAHANVMIAAVAAGMGISPHEAHRLIARQQRAIVDAEVVPA